MNRRTALRHATLLGTALVLTGKSVAHAEGGQLTFDLGQWKTVQFKLGSRVHTVSVEEVFDALVNQSAFPKD